MAFHDASPYSLLAQPAPITIQFERNRAGHRISPVAFAFFEGDHMGIYDRQRLKFEVAAWDDRTKTGMIADEQLRPLA